MKRIITLVLSVLMLASCFAFTHSVSAQDDGVMLSFNYHDKNNGVVDKKQTAVVEKVEIDGTKALKVTPAPDTALTSELRLDCYSLTYSAKELEGVKYMTIKYRYDGGTEINRPMEIQFFATGGALSKGVSAAASENVKSGEWSVAVFDVCAINDSLVAEDGKLLKQFHLWPYGKGSNPKSMTAEQVMYISDITFYNAAPDIEGIKLPEVSDKPAQSTAAPSAPSAPAQVEGALSGDENGFLFSFNYQDKNNGIVDGKKTADLEKVTEDGEKSLKVVPNPETALTSQLALDCWSLGYTQQQIANARFMTIKYKYIAPENAEVGKMALRIIGSSTRAITSAVDAESLSNLVTGEWTTAVFNVSKIGDLLNTANPNGKFTQFHLYPFGKSASVKNMNSDYVMYISDISFYSVNPNPDTAYSVSFKNGNPDISGENPKAMSLKRGEKFTLPQHNYNLGKAIFEGWKSSEDDKLYMPGAEITMPDNDVVYTAVFNIQAALSNYKALDFTAYQNGSCEKRDCITVTNDVFQSKNVVKVVPNPEGLDAAKGAIIDGWSYTPAGIDMGVYKYLVISYYFDGELPGETYLYANIMKRNILTNSYGVKSAQPIESGRWNIAVIDFSGIDEVLLKGAANHILAQMHIYPFYGRKVTDFSGDEALYINSLMFFKEKPDLEIHESYMKGYDGGIFKPQGNMTRAEAATIVARLSAGSDELVPTDKTTSFTDVTADKWYYKYVSYVESLGYLKSYSGTYAPDNAITRAEFVELVYNMGLLKDAGNNGTFTDVAPSHPKAAVISAAGKAGLVNGYDNGDGTFSFKPDATITRAEVVKVINNAYGRSITTEQLSEEVKYSFVDVERDFWAYADIMEATLSHVEDSQAWTFCMVSPYTIFGRTNDNLDYAAGESYLKELDAISAKKIEDVRNTPNMDMTEISGQKYYISNNGSDEADGKTPETAWKTIARMVKEAPNMKIGDAVLFERGGLWRERFSAKTGVTYTAYGEGVKPILYGSPENGADSAKWTLMEGTTNIWVYANELLDVGGIIIDGGKVVGLKEVPDLIGGKYYIRNSNGTKEFDIKTELNENLEFFSEIPTTSQLASQTGKLYFRCDEGNPGELFNQIEFNIKGNVISTGNATDVHYDNLCIMYTGTHGIGSGTTKNLTVTNCEIGWIGGTLQSYTAEGKAVRLGNGIEIYGGVDGFLVDNNYIYQCYDAGATHQIASGGTNNISMYNMTYSNNIIEDCIYNIEYFTGAPATEDIVRDGKNFLIKGNILRRSGYGWGNQRPDSNTSAHIKSWSHRNEYEKGTFIIEENIFDRGSWKLLQTVANYASWCPVYRNNTYIQTIDAGLCEHADLRLTYDCYAEQAIKYEMGDEGAKVYFLPESYKYTGFLSR